MSDGSHDNPYACLKAHVLAESNSAGDWFICPRCKVDMPKNAWAAAHLSEEIQGYCPNEKKGCNTIVELPTELPECEHGRLEINCSDSHETEVD